MEIESIRHKALARMVETGKTKGVLEPQRIARMLSFLLAANSIDELEVPPNFGFHALSGDRKGTYAMTVTRNWRLTFVLTARETLVDLDLEDYH